MGFPMVSAISSCANGEGSATSAMRARQCARARGVSRRELLCSLCGEKCLESPETLSAGNKQRNENAHIARAACRKRVASAASPDCVLIS